MIEYLKYRVKHYLAKDELLELYTLKQRVRDLGVWCSTDEKAVAISKWLQDSQDYPCQLRGAYGSIDDFREYLKTIKGKDDV